MLSLVFSLESFLFCLISFIILMLSELLAMTTGKIDISNLDEDELEDLMARLAVAKQQQRDKRTPEPYSPPQRRREFVTENNDKHRSGRRQEPLTAAPVRTADKISAMEGVYVLECRHI